MKINLKRLLLIVAVFIIAVCCCLPACNGGYDDLPNDNGLNFGRYYSEEGNGVYIEIKEDNKAFFQNLYFSCIDSDESEEEGNITNEVLFTEMQGERSYNYFSDDKNLVFSIDNTHGIGFTYNGTNELEFQGKKYILNKEFNMQNPIVTIEMENGKQIKLELYPEKAPNTVNNFISLAKSGFYDGIIFHRVISGFMIQGGDPAGIGTGGPGYTIKGEFALNGFKQNDIKHVRGVISMARAMNPNSAGSQFFIMHDDASHLDGQYAAFGKVIEGMETVDEIASVATDYNDKPKAPQTMLKVTVETFGVDYPQPKKF